MKKLESLRKILGQDGQNDSKSSSCVIRQKGKEEGASVIFLDPVRHMLVCKRHDQL